MGEGLHFRICVGIYTSLNRISFIHPPPILWENLRGFGMDHPSKRWVGWPRCCFSDQQQPSEFPQKNQLSHEKKKPTFH